ncbi:MAG TPA: DUF190 domain-containing protein [Aquifex aeolicus]|nr:DUF190 domain-containing protein [Aquifex aeolicus]
MTFVLLRIYSSKEENLRDYLLSFIREDIKNVTVLQAIAGFGKGRKFHSEDVEILSHELPIVIEAVDKREKLLKFLENNKHLFYECYLTFERVEIWE